MGTFSYFRIPGGDKNSDYTDSEASEAFIKRAGPGRRSFNPPPWWSLAIQILFFLISISSLLYGFLRTPSDSECTRILTPYCTFYSGPPITTTNRSTTHRIPNRAIDTDWFQPSSRSGSSRVPRPRTSRHIPSDIQIPRYTNTSPRGRMAETMGL